MAVPVEAQVHEHSALSIPRGTRRYSAGASRPTKVRASIRAREGTRIGVAQTHGPENREVAAMRLRPRGRRLVSAVAGPLAALALAAPALAEDPPPPTGEQCAAVRAHRTLPPIQALDPRPGAPRVFAMQFKQDVANVTTYEAFRIK